MTPAHWVGSKRLSPVIYFYLRLKKLISSVGEITLKMKLATLSWEYF